MHISKRIITAIAAFITLQLTLVAQVPLNWTVDEVNPGDDIRLSPDESFFQEGAKSCRMQLHTGAVPYLISDVFYITPEAPYQFSVEVFDNDTAGQVKVYADFYDAYGFNIFGQAPVFSKDTDQWQTISWQGIVPAQAVVGYVLVKYYCQPDLYTFTKVSNIWIDNVQFRESGGANLVFNGGFEEWIVGIEEPGASGDLVKVWPNPASTWVHLTLPGGNNKVMISDFSGKTWLSEEFHSKDEADLQVGSLPAGIYLLTIGNEGRAFHRKLIIAHPGR